MLNSVHFLLTSYLKHVIWDDNLVKDTPINERKKSHFIFELECWKYQDMLVIENVIGLLLWKCVFRWPFLFSQTSTSILWPSDNRIIVLFYILEVYARRRWHSYFWLTSSHFPNELWDISAISHMASSRIFLGKIRFSVQLSVWLYSLSVMIHYETTYILITT